MPSYDPRPLPEGAVIFGKARFQFLTGRMLRMEWAQDGVFEDRATLRVANRRLPAVTTKRRVSGKNLELSTPDVTVCYTDDGKPFSSRNLSIHFRMNGRNVSWRPGMKDRENLGGTLRTLDGIRGDRKEVWKETSPGKWESAGFKPVDLGQGLVSRSGWALVDDSDSIVLDEHPQFGHWPAARPAGERRDWYFLAHGHDYAAALREAKEVFGRQPMPPRWALGYWWSRYWAYTDAELEGLVSQFDAMNLPIDVLVVDMDWHLENWTGYTWDRRYFPDPKEFLRNIRQRGLKVTLNLHPADGVADFEEQFPAMCKALGADGKNTPKLPWDIQKMCEMTGRKPSSVRHIPFDLLDPKFMEAYFRILHHPHERDGVDFWWMDWQQGKDTRLPGLDPLPWVNQLHWEDMERNPERRGRRPLIFSRFGGIGAGRYCVGFSGDTISVWESLKFQPRFTAQASNVLYGYWSHDIGGHMPGEIDPELYTRWIQFGVYSPILRTHTTKNPRAERRIWKYPDPFDRLMMDALRQRYAMAPYIYTECRRMYDSGVSLCRPLYYEWPEEDPAYKALDEYMFGDSILVAPILAPVDAKTEMASRRVWLPPGTWFDTARGCFEKGGQTVERRYLVSETPAFVRPGTILPGQGESRRLKHCGEAALTITAYPGGNGRYELYEDDGETTSYEKDEFTTIELSQKDSKQRRTVAIAPAKGSYKGFRRTRPVEIRMPAVTPPLKVVADGKTLAWAHRLGESGWTYDGSTATVIIRLPRVDLMHGLTVTVEKDGRVPEKLAYGLRGQLARLARVSYHSTLATSVRIQHPRERLGVDAAQAGNRIGRNPASFADEVKRLHRVVRELPTVLKELMNTKTAKLSDQARKNRNEACAKALAILRAMEEDG